MRETLQLYLLGVDEEYERRHRLRGRHEFAWGFEVLRPEHWERRPMQALRRYARQRGVKMARTAIPPRFGKHTRGFLDKRSNLICIDEALDEYNAFHVALHELAHVLVEPRIEGIPDRRVRYGVSEMVAEGVAYVVGQRYLTPTTRASLEYGAFLAPAHKPLYTQALTHAVPEIIRASRILDGELEGYDDV